MIRIIVKSLNEQAFIHLGIGPNYRTFLIKNEKLEEYLREPAEKSFSVHRIIVGGEIEKKED